MEKKPDLNSKYIKLVSSDGASFVIPREHARMSKTLTAMFSNEFVENLTNTVHFKNITKEILELVCSYLEYKCKYRNNINEKRPKFCIPPELSYDLLVAANYLDC